MVDMPKTQQNYVFLIYMYKENLALNKPTIVDMP